MRMFGRFFWFALGAAAGYAVTVRVKRLAEAALLPRSADERPRDPGGVEEQERAGGEE